MSSRSKKKRSSKLRTWLELKDYKLPKLLVLTELLAKLS